MHSTGEKTHQENNKEHPQNPSCSCPGHRHPHPPFAPTHNAMKQQTNKRICCCLNSLPIAPSSPTLKRIEEREGRNSRNKLGMCVCVRARARFSSHASNEAKTKRVVVDLVLFKYFNINININIFVKIIYFKILNKYFLNYKFK
jgi:hypothetical protein